MAGLYGSPDFSVNAGPYSWQSLDDFDPGAFYTLMAEEQRALQNPAIIFKDGKVLGVGGWLIPPGFIPTLLMGDRIFPGSGWTDCYEGTCESYFAPLSLGSGFTMAGGFYYSNRYDGPTFVGSWDFGNSRVTAIPEPSAWALMLLGFAMAGHALRRRRALGQASTRFVPA